MKLPDGTVLAPSREILTWIRERGATAPPPGTSSGAT
jgi:hypothetical protein